MRWQKNVTRPWDPRRIALRSGSTPFSWDAAALRVTALTVLVVVIGLCCGGQRAAARTTRLPRGVRRAHFLTGGRLSDPQASCDVPQPQYQYVTFPSFAQTSQEICGMWSVEDDAEAAYDYLHGYAFGDPRAQSSGLAQQAGYTETLLETLAYEKSNGIALTTDQEGALDWFQAIEQQFQIAVAQDALDQYDRWNTLRCSYLPPNTALFSYRPMDQPACDKVQSAETLYAGLTPPSEADFIAYGTYEADQAFDINGAIGGSSDQLLIDQGITEGAGALATVIGGATPQTLTGVPSLYQGFKDFLDPFTRTSDGLRGNKILNATRKIRGPRVKDEQEVEASDEVDELESEGVDADEIEPELLDTAETADEGLSADAGLLPQETAVAEGGADAMSSIFAVAAVAITVAVTEGEAVFTAAEIPNQLQQNLSEAEHPTDGNSYAWDQLASSEEAVTTLSNVEGQMEMPQPIVGVHVSSTCPTCVVYDTPPAPTSSTSTGASSAQLQMTALNADGTPTGWSSTATTASNIDTWPMGAADGASGVPEVNVAIDDGEVWTSDMAGSAATDQSEAGLSGYLPSGELHYFNAAGQPMIAYLDGDQFETLSDPGSIDAGGADAGDACATAGECTLSSSIVVMAYGGTPQLQDTLQPGTFFGSACSLFISEQHACNSDDLLPDGDLVPAGGSSSATSTGTVQQQGTSQLYRLTIVPDTGTPASMWVANKYNSTANDLSGGAPNGGLVAGQSVTFTDPEISASGYSTTYRWQIQAVCPYDAAHSPQTIQGVPVCSDSPDYGSNSGLAADEQDLTSCSEDVTPGESCNPAAIFGWNEDPAFHGGAVTTLTGQSVNWTWPAPGTYHVRLTTTDQNGVSVTTDRDLVVSAATTPSSSLSWSAASGSQPAAIAPSVVGPVTDGDAVTLTGCVSSPDTIGASSYTTPSVKVDWGDGSTPDSGTAGSSTDTNLTFTFDPSSGCATPWEYRATHTYSLSTSGQPFMQVPVTVTVADVTDPATPPSSLPAGTSTSSTVKLYADVYPSSAAPSFVSGATTSYAFTAGDTQTVHGYVTSASDATITDTAANGVSQSGASCTAGLPAGMALTPAAGNSFTIEGTPAVTAGGCYALEVTATNGYGSADEQVIVDVAQAPAFTSATSAGWSTGSTGSFTVATSGFPAPALTVTGVTCSTGCSSALPSDISFVDNGNGTATLSSGGSDIAAGDAGVYVLTLSASSSTGTQTQTLTLTIGGKPVFMADSAGFTTQQDGHFMIYASASPAVSSITCTISGDPCVSTSTGDSLIDSNYTGNNSYGLYFRDLDAANPAQPGTAALLGAPYASGEYTVTLTATNAVGSTTEQFSILVSASGGVQLTMVANNNDNLVSYTAPAGEAPAFGTARFIVGQAGSVTLCSNDPTDTLTSQSQLPAGLTLTNGVTDTLCPGGDEQATISGTPSATLNAGSTGTIADRIVSTANGLADLTIELIGPGSGSGADEYELGAPSFTSPSRAVFTEGTSGSFTASLGTLYYYGGILYGCLSESGALPPGLSFSDHDNNTAALSGSPTPTATLKSVSCGSDPANLPSGVTFADDGDGSATLSGTAAIGAGAACPGGYSLDVELANAAGTIDEPLTLKVQEVISATTPATTAAIVPGAPNQIVLGAAGSPAPAFAPAAATPLPAWLKLTSLGNGTAALSGRPPVGAAGSSIGFSVDVTNSDASTLVESITVPVAKIALTKATPPAARIGHPYSYRFKASAHATFSLAPGSLLPLGLALSRSGRLSGTPKELGRFALGLEITSAGQTVRTGMIELAVDAGRHPLEIAQFRTVGPKGQGDWFVQLVNTTTVTIPLTGWRLGLQPAGSKRPMLISLGSGKLGAGRTVVISGTGSSLRARLSAHHFAATSVPVRSGFEVVAPSGSVVDAAGLRGALRPLRAGDGVHYPRHVLRHKQYAFVRHGFAAGHPVDTGNNARNFTFGDVVLHPRRAARVTHHATNKKHQKKRAQEPPISA